MLIKKLLFGYYNTQCLYVVVELGIADLLKSKPRHISYLAEKTSVNGDKLYRIMRFLCAQGLFDELEEKSFSINNESRLLISSSSSNMCDFSKLHGKYFYKSASKILEGVKSKQIPFEIEYGSPVWDFLKDHSEAAEVFNNAMKHTADLQAKVISEIYDFNPYSTIVDLGGGLGSLLVNILHKYKHIKGINLDLPSLEDGANSYFTSQNLKKRCKYISGSFLEEIPKNADLYILKAILHGKSDDLSKQILQNCISAMNSLGRVLVIDRIIDSRKDYLDACINDINMLNVSGAGDRTLQEFQQIFDEVNLEVLSIKRVQESLSIIELAKK